MTEIAIDNKMMARALELAARGRGETSPNPMVGAVLVKNGRIVGEGYHRKAGTAHAEIVALNQAGKKGNGATLYITLEPCCHTGRTGPCVERIIDARIAKVIYAVNDPNPEVNGKGARKLRRSGVKVQSGLMRNECLRLNETFFTFHRTGRPFVIVKSAQSLDGRVATSNGDSKYITGVAALKYAHKLRAEVDAVLVGAGTARVDNPSLTVRRVRGKNPLRIILSTSLNIPRRSRMFGDGNGPVILASTKKAITRSEKKFSDRNVSFWPIRHSGPKRLDLCAFLDKAAEFGLQSILVEGGPSLATSFIRQGLADKVIVITAPLMIGKGVSTFGDFGVSSLTQAIRFRQAGFSALGNDCLFIGYPEKRV